MPFAAIGMTYAINRRYVAIKDGRSAAIGTSFAAKNGLGAATARSSIAKGGRYTAICMPVVWPVMAVAVKNGAGERLGVAVAAKGLSLAAIRVTDAANGV
jgi:hypothetical protein